jgi:hypothetical protein
VAGANTRAASYRPLEGMFGIHRQSSAWRRPFTTMMLKQASNMKQRPDVFGMQLLQPLHWAALQAACVK